jgi:polyvinyl alcohol dehydrogenase (cytochrome)
MKLTDVAAGLLLLSLFPAAAQQRGAALYDRYCAQCHDSGNQQGRAPS